MPCRRDHQPGGHTAPGTKGSYLQHIMQRPQRARVNGAEFHSDSRVGPFCGPQGRIDVRSMITQTFSQTRHPGSGILITDSRSLLHLATALGTVASSGTAAVPRPSEAAAAGPRNERPHLARRGERATVRRTTNPGPPLANR